MDNSEQLTARIEHGQLVTIESHEFEALSKVLPSGTYSVMISGRLISIRNKCVHDLYREHAENTTGEY